MKCETCGTWVVSVKILKEYQEWRMKRGEHGVLRRILLIHKEIIIDVVLGFCTASNDTVHFPKVQQKSKCLIG